MLKRTFYPKRISTFTERAGWLCWGGGLVLFSVLLSLLLGRYPSPYLTKPTDLVQNELARNVLLNLRLPRVLAAVMLGGLLATAAPAAAQGYGGTCCGPTGYYTPYYACGGSPYKCYYYYFYYYKGKSAAEGRRNFDEFSRYFVSTDHGYQGYRYLVRVR